MSEARDLLNAGLADLVGQLGESFTVDGYPQTFTGVIDDTAFSNALGLGGFMPDAEGILAVPLDQFDSVGLKPYTGLRVTLRGREWIVGKVNYNLERYDLPLTIAHPKPSDFPS